MVLCLRLRVASAVLATGVISVVVPAMPAQASDSPICPVAKDLTDSHHPRKALAVIAAARADAAMPAICGDEEGAAAAEVARAAGLLAPAAIAESKAKDLDGSDEAALVAAWRKAQTAASAVLAVDADNKAAAGIRDEAKKHIPEPPEQQSDSNPLTRADADESEWKAFKKDVVDPMSTLVLAGLAIVLGIAVAARLVVLVWPWKWPRFRLGAITVWAIVGAVTAVLSFASPWWLDSASPLLVLGTGLAFVASAAAWAMAIGSRMRLTVQVRDAEGKEDEGATTQLIAMLRELGGDPPAGLEVPRGTDVEVLNGKAITDVKNGWLAAALAALQMLLGVTPWRVVVDIHDSGDAHAVMTRNGKNVGSAVLKAAPFGAEGPKVEPVNMAAAFVLLVLSHGYRSGFDGLSGAQDWHSIGWLNAATSGAVDDDQKATLFSHAVDADPRNMAAQIAFRHHRDRLNSDTAVSERYVKWLIARIYEPANEGAQNRPLRIRLRHTATAVTLNRWHGLTGLDKTVERVLAKCLADRLCDELAELPTDDRFGNTLRPVADSLRAIAYGLPNPSGSAVLGSTTLDFDLACMHEVRDERGEAIDRLASVMAGAGGRDEVSKDPFLKVLATSTDFLERYPGEPRTDMLEVSPFKDHADRLRAAGLGTPVSLIAPSVTRSELARYLGAADLANQLRGLAEILSIAPVELADLQYEVIEIISDQGIRRGSDLEQHPVEVAAIVRALRKRALLVDADGRQLLGEWLDAAAQSPGGAGLGLAGVLSGWLP